MNIHFISTCGKHDSFKHDEQFPISLERLFAAAKAYIKSPLELGIVVNDQIIDNMDFVVQKHHEVWILPKAIFDIKSWRARKAVGK